LFGSQPARILVAGGSCPQSSGEASEVGFCQGVGVDAADAEQVDDVLVPQRRQGEPHEGRRSRPDALVRPSERESG
jgi:hypothetical protein